MVDHVRRYEHRSGTLGVKGCRRPLPPPPPARRLRPQHGAVLPLCIAHGQAAPRELQHPADLYNLKQRYLPLRNLPWSAAADHLQVPLQPGRPPPPAAHALPSTVGTPFCAASSQRGCRRGRSTCAGGGTDGERWLTGRYACRCKTRTSHAVCEPAATRCPAIQPFNPA